MYVMTPRFAAAAVVSAVVGAPTKYAHPYSMMHRRLTTTSAGIEVAPHYHKLLVILRFKARQL